jgi:hypothetical protein
MKKENHKNLLKRGVKKTAIIANFGVIEKKAVTLVGAPSYTSGAQKWKGAAVSLNKKPTAIKRIPTERKL